ncbi:hypothetical protein ACTXT7_005907 [Hymenolepis weldensis]
MTSDSMPVPTKNLLEKQVPAQDPSARRHRQIIRWFADSPHSPLSIHKLIQASGCSPGTHFGPAAVCRALLIAMAWTEDEDLSQIALANGENVTHFSSQTGTIDIMDQHLLTALSLIDEDHTSSSKAQNNHSHSNGSSDLSDDHVLNNLVAATSDLRISDKSATNEPKRGLLLLLPMRLGAGHRIDPNYVQTLLQLIQDPVCIGLIGGRPRHSIYAPAVQSDRIFYLDPHFNQPTLNISDLSEDSNFDVSSWHCSCPQKMMVRDLDPSLALGFYCGSRQEILDLLDRLPTASQLALTSPNSSPHQLIEVVNESERARLFSLKSRKTQLTSVTNPYPPIGGENGSNQIANGSQGDDLEDEDGETCLVDF